MSDGTVEESYRPFKAVTGCGSVACRLHPYREGRKAECVDSPLKAIQQHCFGCLGGNEDSISLGGRTFTRARPNKLISRCQQQDCPLYPFKHGREPSRRAGH